MTLVEAMVVVGIIGVLAALSAPSLRQWRANERVRTTARMVADAMSVARAEALRTSDNHIVFIGEDISGVPLTDVNGRPVVMIHADDDADCFVDAGEATRTYSFDTGVGLGSGAATSPHGLDVGDGTFTDGLTFFQPTAGAPEAAWAFFGPDGVPVGLTAGCVAGTTGSGGGGVYITGAARAYSVVLTPLGGVRVDGWEAGSNLWQ
jgi:type II secretory pathway pseudopilin PulG